MIARIHNGLPKSPVPSRAPESPGEPKEGTPAGESWLRPVEQFVTAHPGMSLAIAVAVGVTIGWWIKRK